MVLRRSDGTQEACPGISPEGSGLTKRMNAQRVGWQRDKWDEPGSER